MRNHRMQVGLLTLTASVFVCSAQCAPAQLTNASATNAIHRWTEDAYRRAQTKVRDALAQATNSHPNLSSEDIEWAASLAAGYSPKPWPDAAQKQATLLHATATLRSAIHTDEIEQACLQMTNQPEAVVALKNLGAEAISNLDECADVLASPHVRADVAELGYLADSWGRSNYFSFVFWSANKLPTVLRTVEKRTADGAAVIMLARFYESGKLELLQMVPRDNKGAITGSEGLSFKEDGKLDRHWIEPR